MRRLKRGQLLPPLTEADLVDILVNYDVVTGRLITEGEGRVLGLTDKDKRIIYLAKDLSVPERRETILHELYHAYCDLQNIMDVEKIVDESAKREYERHYGGEKS